MRVQFRFQATLDHGFGQFFLLILQLFMVQVLAIYTN
jgi:hypothetical protein